MVQREEIEMRNKNEVPPSCMATVVQGLHCVLGNSGFVNNRWSRVVLFPTIV